MSNVTFLWIFSRGIELGVIVLCLLPLRAILRKKGPRLLSYLLWSALPINVVYNFCIWILPREYHLIEAYMPKRSPIVISETFLEIMKSVWFVGTTVVLIRMLLSYIQFRMRLIGSIRMEENIYLVGRIKAPFSMGLFRTKIYLPTSVAEEWRESVILHEKVHIARKDIWMKYIAVAVLGLFWFQPILWFAYRLFVNDMEEACDETVLQKKGRDFREEYARSLVEVSFHTRKVQGAAVGYGNGALRTRIRNVMNYRRISGRKFAISILIWVFFVLVAIPISWQVPKMIRVENRITRKNMSVTGEETNKMEVYTEEITYIGTKGEGNEED